MSTTHTHRHDETIQQDRTLTDLLESFRHLQSDPTIDERRKQEATERMSEVWSRLARLNDPDGLSNHLSEYIRREHARRHHHDAHDTERRTNPLCRCDRSRHVCEVKRGEVPSELRTDDLTYLDSPDTRTLARKYVQSHAGDVVVGEALGEFRSLRSDIYAELSGILALLRRPVDEDEPHDEQPARVEQPAEDEHQDAHDEEPEGEVPESAESVETVTASEPAGTTETVDSPPEPPEESTEKPEPESLSDEDLEALRKKEGLTRLEVARLKAQRNGDNE